MQKVLIFAFFLTFCQNVLSDDKQNSQQLDEILKRLETLEKENMKLNDQIKDLLTPEPNGVYFSAYLNAGGNIGSDSEDFPITFNNVLLNYGNGFEGESGTFTAPLSGYYSFHFDGGQYSHGTTDIGNRVYVYKNSQFMLEMLDSGPEYGHYQHIHFSFEENLDKGETINLKVFQGDWLIADSVFRISFSGELLYVE